MKNIFLIGVATLLMVPGMIKVNGQFDERLERFQAQKIAYFTERMQLTAKEAEKFWPVYNDYTNRKEKLEEESRNILRYLTRNAENIPEKEVNESLSKYVQHQDKIHTMFMEYHQKYIEILPPQKVAKIYTTEVQFRTFLLHQIREGRQERNPRRF